MPKLIFTKEPFDGRVYDLTLEKTSIGRGDQNVLALHDPSVSQKHCEILVHGPEVIVHDLGSANGTYVEGVKVTEQAQIKHRQLLRIGKVEARLELEDVDPDESISGMDTIHMMGRIMRDQKREERKPKPADPAMKLESAGVNEVENTMVMSAIPAEKIQTGLESRQPELSSGRPPILKILIAVCLVIAFALWMLWRKK